MIAKVKAFFAAAVPYFVNFFSALKPAAVKVYSWMKTLVVTVLMPAWVPVVTLARNPLTAVMMLLCIGAAYLGGDLVRALKDNNNLADLKSRYEAAMEKQHTADLAHEAGIILNYQNELEAMSKATGAKVAAPVAVPKAVVKKTVATPKPTPSLFSGLFGG